jgi:hypothetical protein
MNELHVFATALEIASPVQRARYLDVACGHNQALRRRIDELLRSYEEAGNFMQIRFGAAAADESPPEEPRAEVGLAVQKASALSDLAGVYRKRKVEDNKRRDLGAGAPE